MIRIYQVDSFTKEAYKGNPAGICILDTMPNEEWMKKVAREMNLSETAFIVKKDDLYDLRWFTPLIEINLCGHATLAAAHILWSEGYHQQDADIQFYTKSGILKTKKEDKWIEMNFPLLRYEESVVPKELIKALNIEPKYTCKSNDNYLIEVTSPEMVENLRPNFKLLSKIDMHGVIVTSQSTGEYDFVSRFFAPSVGVNEDPVTGSAHCVLANYWKERLKKEKFKAYQLSLRGGEIGLKVDGERVKIRGQAVTVLRGEIIDNTTQTVNGQHHITDCYQHS